MAYTEWSMQGFEVANCNCNWGCPCQFNQLPTHGDCRAYTFVQIDQGHYGDVPLNGLRWGFVAAWPGPIHKGNGRFLTVVDERADTRQRAALETISHGKDTEPGAVVWAVFATAITEFLPTVAKPIEMTADIENRTAEVRVAGLLDGRVAPILNPITKKPHRARVTLPYGFEYTDAEFASGDATVGGDIPLDFHGTHAHLARIHWTTHGVVR